MTPREREAIRQVIQTRADHAMPRACLLCHKPARDFDGYCGDAHAALGACGDDLTAIICDLMGLEEIDKVVTTE